MKKSILLLLAIICAMLQASAQPSGNWYAGAASHPALTKPTGIYEIDTEEKLARLAYEVNEDGKTFAGETVVLMTDLDLSAHYWTPIGQYSTNPDNDPSFRGTFDGKGRTISGLNIDDDVDRLVTGLFGLCYGDVTIKNLTLDIGTIQGKNNENCRVGALAGYIFNNAATPATITDCRVLTTSGGSVTGEANSNLSSIVGGLIGRIDGRYAVTNCSNAADVLNNSPECLTRTGGLIGVVITDFDSYITNCFNTGAVTSVRNSNINHSDCIGGIVGAIETSIGITFNLTDCYSKATVTAGDHNSPRATIGGIVGNIMNLGTVDLTHCYATGEIVGKKSDAGGIVGFIDNANGTTDLTKCVAIQTSFTGEGTKNRILGNSGGVVADITLSKNWAFIGTDNQGWGASNHAGENGASIATAADRYSKSTYDASDPNGPAFNFTNVWYMPLGSGQTPVLRIVVYPKGDGTPNNPFVIQTRKDLDMLSNAVNMGQNYAGIHFKLDPVDANGQPTNVLYMGTTPFIPIGRYTGNPAADPSFQGTFDGNGKTISGLTIDDDVDREATGLFGFCYGDVTIKDLTLDIGTIQGKNNDFCYVGALAGYIYDGAAAAASITNCHVLTTSGGGVMGVTNINGTSSIAGLIGRMNGRYAVTSCSNAVDVLNSSTVGSAVTGGLIAIVEALSGTPAITSCFNTGKVRSMLDAVGGIENYIGGITGYIWTNAGATLNIADCYSKAIVMAGDLNSPSSTGGIVGRIYNNGTVDLTHCYAAGEIVGKTSDAGGIAGFIFNNNGAVSLTNCVAIQTSFTGTGTNNRILGKSDGAVAAITLSNNWAFIGTDQTLWGNFGHDQLGGASLASAADRYSKSTYDASNANGPDFDFTNTWYMPLGSGQTPVLRIIVYPKGDGSPNDPYVIQTRADLDMLSNAVNMGENYAGKYFKLDPVDANGQPSDVLYMGTTPFVPIGLLSGNAAASPSFRGTFDGNGKTISGLNIDDDVDREAIGLFGLCYGAVTIKDLTLDIGTIQGKNNGYCHIGALAGYIRNNTAAPVTITNCHVLNSSGTSMVQRDNSTNVSFIGGLIGYIYSYFSITKCSNAADVLNKGESEDSFLGGLIGEANLPLNNSEITACFNTGKLTGPGSGIAGDDTHIGGVVGFINTNPNATLNINNCYNTGDITAGNFQNINSTGGIAGHIWNDGTVNLTHCYAAGTIVGKDSDAGGILGSVKILDGGVYINNCLAIQSSITGTSANRHRIVGGNENPAIGISASDNYALQTMQGAPAGGWPNDDAGWDGAHWTGTMTDAPINVWAAAGWTVDLTSKLMPKLGGLTVIEPDIINPLSLKTITVSFDMQGAPAINPQPVGFLQKISRPTPDPTYTGYLFVDWYADAACNTLFDFSYTVHAFSNDTIIYAKWAPNKFTVTFDSQGGTAIPAITDLLSGATIQSPGPNPEKDDYIFGGWYKEAACLNAWNFSTDVITQDTTLFAKWISPTQPTPPALYKVSLTLLLDNQDLASCVSLYPDAGTYEVQAGKEMTVLVFLNDDCDLSDAKMTVNGDTIIADEKKEDLRAISYTFRFTVTGETDVKVIDIKRNNPIGNSPEPGEKAAVWTTSGQIHISLNKGAIRIYTLSGQLVTSTASVQHSPMSYKVPAGVYLVVAGDEVFKVQVR